MKIFAIASLTVREAFRKRIVIAGLLVTVLFLALYATGVHFALSALSNAARSGDTPGGIREAKTFLTFEANIFLVLGVFVANIIGALAATFSAVGSISSEIEQGTLQTIVTRPLKRRQIILGKWLGHAVLLTVYLGALFLLIVIIIYSQSGWLPRNIYLATLAFILESLIVLSVTLFGSTFLSSTVNAVIVFMLYLTALIGGIMEQIGIMIGKKALFTTGIISGFIMPTDSLYRYVVYLLRPVRSKLEVYLPGAADLGPFGAASPPSSLMLLYALLFLTVFLIGAVALFSRRDL